MHFIFNLYRSYDIRFGAKLIIAVDVSSDWTLNADHNYGDMLNGLSVWLSRLNPWAKTKLVIFYTNNNFFILF
jgi:hypothetical protein